MATLIAKNVDAVAGKWVPYYWKPFFLGTQGVSASSTDGETYITQTNGSSDVGVRGWCTSSHNCGHYYTITTGDSGPTNDNFYVEKFTNAGVLVDTLYASVTSVGQNGNWWYKEASPITIDIGVVIALDSETDFGTSDVYKIELPSADTMDRRKIWHGGYSTFLRIPEDEGRVYHSEIIPSNLKNKGINVNLGYYLGAEVGADSVVECLTVCTSLELILGNSAVTCGIQWNHGPGKNETNTVGVIGADVGNYHAGTIFYEDVNPQSTVDMNVNTHSSPTTVRGTDVWDTANRAGHASMYLAYNDGAGGNKKIAHNQFWPITITFT